MHARKHRYGPSFGTGCVSQNLCPSDLASSPALAAPPTCSDCIMRRRSASVSLVFLSSAAMALTRVGFKKCKNAASFGATLGGGLPAGPLFVILPAFCRRTQIHTIQICCCAILGSHRACAIFTFCLSVAVARMELRLQKEIRQLEFNPPPGVTAWPVEDSLIHLNAGSSRSPLFSTLVILHGTYAMQYRGRHIP